MEPATPSKEHLARGSLTSQGATLKGTCLGISSSLELYPTSTGNRDIKEAELSLGSSAGRKHGSLGPMRCLVRVPAAALLHMEGVIASLYDSLPHTDSRDALFPDPENRESGGGEV